MMEHLDEFTLNEYLDEALNETERRTVKTHLDACDTCRRTLADLQLVFTRLEEIEELPLTVDLSARVMAELPAPAKPTFRPAILLALQAAGAMVMLFFLWPSIQTLLTVSSGTTTTFFSTWTAQIQGTWTALMNQITTAITQIEVPTVSFDLATGQWIALLLLVSALWLAGNRVFLTTTNVNGGQQYG